MFKNPFYYGERGCLWYAIEFALTFYAVLCLITGKDTRFAWAILITDVVDITALIVNRLVNKKVERERYYREDSFWLREKEPDDQQKEDLHN